ncbi:MAG: hypothetical protein H6767_09590 [Candidatus Peribacteria bacterium]|nr:MAG: hypothetical protein H6767_09590 [Candidatus Peribacteria bacterium]
MKVEFIELFDKDLSGIDKSLLKRIFTKINDIKCSPEINSIAGIKKLHGFKNYYRIRI